MTNVLLAFQTTDYTKEKHKLKKTKVSIFILDHSKRKTKHMLVLSVGFLINVRTALIVHAFIHEDIRTKSFYSVA